MMTYKMDKNYYPINIQEEILCKIISEMNNSTEIKDFAKELESIIKDNSEIFSFRIKEQFSAIRTYRLANYNNAEQMHDLLGFLIVVDNNLEIKKIEELLKNYLTEENIKIYNLLNEKEFKTIQYNTIQEHIEKRQYNQLIFNDINEWLYIPKDLNKLLPPFSYNILCKKKFEDIDYQIPIEIRIQTKEDFITTESYYYTIHKNDTINLNKKIPLLCMCFRILRRMTNIAFEKDISVRERYEEEIRKIEDSNKKFIEQNKEELERVFLEHNKIVNCWKGKQPIYNFIRNTT